MLIIFVVSNPTSRREHGSSPHSRFSVSCVPVVFWKPSALVALVTQADGHMRSLQNGGDSFEGCVVFVTDSPLRYYMLLHSTKWRPAPETRTLCNEILQATIPDPDKHQLGLTKIFFRAGMLATLESLRSKRLAELVILIQKNVKRRLAQQKYQRLRRSAIRIQTWWRGILAHRFVLTLRKEAAALSFQRAARTFIQRQRFVAVRQSVIKLQSRTCLDSTGFAVYL